MDLEMLYEHDYQNIKLAFQYGILEFPKDEKYHLTDI